MRAWAVFMASSQSLDGVSDGLKQAYLVLVRQAKGSGQFTTRKGLVGRARRYAREGCSDQNHGQRRRRSWAGGSSPRWPRPMREHQVVEGVMSPSPRKGDLPQGRSKTPPVMSYTQRIDTGVEEPLPSSVVEPRAPATLESEDRGLPTTPCATMRARLKRMEKAAGVANITELVPHSNAARGAISPSRSTAASASNSMRSAGFSNETIDSRCV